MSQDAITSAYLLGALIMAATNTAALLADRGATGVRPYCAAYMAVGNGWLAYNFAVLGQPGAATVSAAFCALNAVNATLIARYRRMATK
jgi:K+ transporter